MKMEKTLKLENSKNKKTKIYHFNLTNLRLSDIAGYVFLFFFIKYSVISSATALQYLPPLFRTIQYSVMLHEWLVTILWLSIKLFVAVWLITGLIAHLFKSYITLKEQLKNQSKLAFKITSVIIGVIMIVKIFA